MTFSDIFKNRATTDAIRKNNDFIRNSGREYAWGRDSLGREVLSFVKTGEEMNKETNDLIKTSTTIVAGLCALATAGYMGIQYLMNRGDQGE